MRQGCDHKLTHTPRTHAQRTCTQTHVRTHTNTCAHTCMLTHAPTPRAHKHMYTHQLPSCLKIMAAPALKRSLSRACDAGPVPPLDDAQIKFALEEYVKTEHPFEFGSYSRMRRAQAVDGSGLVHNKVLLQLLFRMQPSGRFHAKQFERSICDVLEGAPTINTTQFPNVHYARWASKQISVMTAHTRRCIHSDARLTEAVRKLDPIERALLDHLLGTCRNTALGDARKRRRVLGREMSLDADGWPRQPDNEEEEEEEEDEEQESDHEEEKSDQQEKESDEEDEKSDQQEEEEGQGEESDQQEEEEEADPFHGELPGSVGDLMDMLCSSAPSAPSTSSRAPRARSTSVKRPAGQNIPMPKFVRPESKAGKAYIAALAAREQTPQTPVPAQRGGQKAAALKKRPAAEAQKQSTTHGHSPVLGSLKLTSASAKTYICSRAEGESKWTHVCSVYSSQSPDHAIYAQHIMRQMQVQPLDKTDAITLRDALIAGNTSVDTLAQSDAEDEGTIWND